MKKWTKLKPKQFEWLNALIVLWCTGLILIWCSFKKFEGEKLMIIMVIFLGAGILFFTIILYRNKAIKKKSKLMENFIRRNDLYKYHYVTVNGLNGKQRVEHIDYYPIVEYCEKIHENIFCIRIRMDGCLLSEKFREMEGALADMFYTVCTDRIEERGYLTYCFELQEQDQMQIKSQKDILPVGDHEIAISRDIVWDWIKSPHLLLTGYTGSGKSQLAQYIISCLLEQGVRVIYCDPKNDDDMRLFMKGKPAVYVTKENDIARAVRETEEQVRLRETDLQSIRLEEAEFYPIFLLFDELIAYSKTAEKKTYEETAKRLSSIVVTGRSKRVYAGIILQRPDTSFIEGAIRDNFHCRICMKNMTPTAYRMVFGEDFADVKNNRRDIGSGLIFRQGVDTKPREFRAPYICKGALSRN